MSDEPAVELPPEKGPAHSVTGHLRATGLLVILTLFFGSFVYPVVVTEIAHVVDPSAAGGSLLTENGKVIGSALIAQNLTNRSQPWLFWSRPSLTDYNLTLGAPSPPGPTEPSLAALLNETLSYMRLYGNFTVNATLPFWLVAPSASSVDPDLVPEAVLIQIPRVAAATNLSIAYLTAFVNAHITNPPLPFLGVPYVNVLELDLALLPIIGKPA